MPMIGIKDSMPAINDQFLPPKYFVPRFGLVADSGIKS
jgi:hypothetical protein